MTRQQLNEERKTPYAPGTQPNVYTAEPGPEPGLRWIPEIGDRRTFVPAAFEGEHQQGLRSIRPDADAKVTGTVISINEAHRWCRVRFELPGGVPAFECFKY